MDFIARLVAAAKPRSVLDAGCGDGRFHEFLRRHLDRHEVRYTGVDLSERAIQLAHVLTRGADFRCIDLRAVPERFDAAVLIEVLEHISDEQVSSFLGAVLDRLEPGGALWISVPSDNLPVNPKHHRHYNATSLTGHLAGAGLRVEDLWYVSRRNWWTRRLRRLLANGWWTLNISPLTRLLWRLHQRHGVPATAGTAQHVVARARRA